MRQQTIQFGLHLHLEQLTQAQFTPCLTMGDGCRYGILGDGRLVGDRFAFQR